MFLTDKSYVRNGPGPILMILNKENKRKKSLRIPVHSDFENMILRIKTICASSNILYATLTIKYYNIKSSLIILFEKFENFLKFVRIIS